MTILRADDGERVSAKVVIKADLEQLALTWSDYAPGDEGPEAHVHREHADCFYVLEGELTFELGGEGERRQARAGGFVLVPPGVVHTFRNEGSGQARFLNIHAPNCGFADHLRGDDEGFDSFDPPADGGRPASEAVVRPAGDGNQLSIGAGGVLIKAGATDDPGTLSLLESTIPAGFPGPVPHVHRATVDSFWVLEGTLTVRVEDRTEEVAPGGYAVVPPGVVHTFSNPTDQPLRMLNPMCPGGFERYFEEVVKLESPDPQEMAKIASRYDFEAVTA